MRDASTSHAWFRIWLARYSDWRPERWNDVPPRALAVEPAAPTCFSPVDAAAFVEGFNNQMLDDPRNVWAVAVPVTICYAGDLQGGAGVDRVAFRFDD